MRLSKQNQISIRIIDDIREFAQYRDNWNTFAAECGVNDTFYLTHDRIAIWWQHFGPPSRLNIVVITKDGNIIGIFPLCRTEYKLGPVRLNCLETIGARAGNTVGLFRERDAEETTGAFFDYIRSATNGNNTILKLDFVPDDSRFYKLLRHQKNECSQKFISKDKTQTVGLYINLEQGWNEYRNSLTVDWKSTIRYLLKRSNAANRIKYGKFDINNLNEGLNRLFALHVERWQTEKIISPFTKPEYCRYYKDIAAAFWKNDCLHFTYLTVDGNIGSLYFSIIYNDKFYGMIVARDIRYAKSGLGHIHHWYMIQEAFQRGLKEIDFLVGDEAYKHHWTQQYRKYQNILITGYKPWGQPRIFYYYLLLRLMQFIRNKHTMKELISIYRLQKNNNRLLKYFPKSGGKRKTKD